MTSPPFRPKFITFDCYGTLIHFRMADMAQSLYAERVAAAAMPDFCRDFAAYRLDEVLGAWTPYADVVANALRRTCKRWGIAYRETDGAAITAAVPTWGPHPDVPDGLARTAAAIPLVILSNAADSQIHDNVARLGAPFHRVCTAEQAQAYKPRFQAFEYMLDELGADPKDIMHVSSSFRYDLMSAYDLKFGARVFVARGHEPANPYYVTHVISDLGGLPGLVGL